MLSGVAKSQTQDQSIVVGTSTQDWSYQQCKDECTERESCMSFDYCSCKKTDRDEKCFLKTKVMSDIEIGNVDEDVGDKECVTVVRECKFGRWPEPHGKILS
jgi:hypothetical protein